MKTRFIPMLYWASELEEVHTIKDSLQCEWDQRNAAEELENSDRPMYLGSFEDGSIFTIEPVE